MFVPPKDTLVTPSGFRMGGRSERVRPAKQTPKGRLLTEHEWRGIGIQQNRGWIHYAMHR